jgi:hypothetical protein
VDAANAKAYGAKMKLDPSDTPEQQGAAATAMHQEARHKMLTSKGYPEDAAVAARLAAVAHRRHGSPKHLAAAEAMDRKAADADALATTRVPSILGPLAKTTPVVTADAPATALNPTDAHVQGRVSGIYTGIADRARRDAAAFASDGNQAKADAMRQR